MLSIVDADDGSGDGMLQLPQDILDQLGWEIGDFLDIEVVEDEGRTVILIRKLRDHNDL